MHRREPFAQHGKGNHSHHRRTVVQQAHNGGAHGVARRKVRCPIHRVHHPHRVFVQAAAAFLPEDRQARPFCQGLTDALLNLHVGFRGEIPRALSNHRLRANA